MTFTGEFPSLRSIADVLRTTTEGLARELAQQTDTPPDWTDVEWRIAMAVASMHGVSSLLKTSLRWEGPPAWQTFLTSQRFHTCNRHERIMQLKSHLDAEARCAGIPVVALKGAALYGIGVYECGDRPMADLDILIRPQDREPAFSMLARLGYSLSYTTPRHWVFLPSDRGSCESLGEHSDNLIPIEVHASTTEWLPIAPIDISEALWTMSPQPGLNPYPSVAALMRHVLHHAAGAACFRGLRLLHLQDIARLSARMHGEDWRWILSSCDDQSAWWVFPPLLLTARYFGGIPAAVLDLAESNCHRRLRRACRDWRISDVSLSALWIRAFPGIEWCSSLPEVFRYASQRIRPPRRVIDARRSLAQDTTQLAGSGWAHLSQTRRIARWIRSRPPRVETIRTVSAAWQATAD